MDGMVKIEVWVPADKADEVREAIDEIITPVTIAPGVLENFAERMNAVAEAQNRAAIINSQAMAQKRADLINAGYSQGATYAILAAAKADTT